jgi:amino acid transporter
MIVIHRSFFAAAAASFMNTVILSSVISAGNHALFAGTRVLYGLAQVSQAPSLFLWTTPKGVPLPAMLLTSSISVLCFGSSFIGSGQLWAWLQNLVGVSNQVRVRARSPFSRRWDGNTVPRKRDVSLFITACAMWLMRALLFFFPLARAPCRVVSCRVAVYCPLDRVVVDRNCVVAP